MNYRDWFDIRQLELPAGTLYSKPGVRGFPDLPPASDILQRLDLTGSGTLLDLTGTAGLAALSAVSQGRGSVAVIEPSAAALNCAARTHRPHGTSVTAGMLAEEAGAPVDAVVLLPPADRGNARVELEIRSAAAALAPAGRLLLVNHKDRGAKRYEKLAATLFGHSDVIRRDGGWRVLDCLQPLDGPAATEPAVRFEAGGFDLTAIKGTFAAGKLDPGTAQLLAAYGDPERLNGQRVLDLGCGYGMLALTAAQAGAAVTAVDDDLGAVRSTVHNAETLGLADRITAHHSDLDQALPEAGRFDTILMNPPFHVGKGVRLDLPRAFIATAWQRLAPGGELWLVANRALPYEPLLTAFSSWQEVRSEAGFKVLRAVR